MKSAQWLIVLLASAGLSFYTGYQVSAKSGSEPGYFDAVEAAGYGGGSEGVEGVSQELADYYKSLLEDE
ncbi:MAG: hypothetical protein R3231_01905 [bacterium]|nr:hypothetical protein [bacterium]